MHDRSNDWDLLNIYADGALSPADAAALEARLAAEPDLQATLDRILDLKAQLAELRPPGTAPSISDRPRRRRVFVAAAAIAAALVLAIGLAAGLYAWRADRSVWLADAEHLHQQLSHKAYVVEERHAVRLISSGQALEFHAPDLTGSRLFLVDVATSRWSGRETIAMHYRGMHGCRLTVVAIEGSADDNLGTIDPSVGMVRAWPHAGFQFAVVANGMDPQRFEAVADYAQAAITEPVTDTDDLRVAMAERYRTARPCA